MAALVIAAPGLVAARPPTTGACLPMPACGLYCPQGMAHDAQGCPQCACSPDPLHRNPATPPPVRPPPLPPPSFAVPSQPFVAPLGQWEWFNRVVVSLRADSSVVGTNGEHGMWRVLDPQRRTLVIEWSAGWVDSLTLSADGNTLDGFNQQGTRVSARRRFGRPAPLSVATAPSDEAIGTFEGVHPHWRDRVFILRDGTYRRSNGDGGRFTFDGQTLTLYWDRWGSVALHLRGPGYFADASNTFSLRKIGPAR